MIKSFGIMKRKRGLTLEQFLHHWEKVHAPVFLAKNVPGFRRYVQNHRVNVEGPEFESDFDGIAEEWFDDVESIQALHRWLNSSPEADDLREEGAQYVEVEELEPLFIAEEHVLKE